MPRSIAREILGAALLLCSCARGPDAVSSSDRAAAASRAPIASSLPPAAPSSTALPPSPDLPVTSATPAPPPPPAATVNTAAYPWLADRSCADQTVAGPLSARLPPPAGFDRVHVAPGSFGEWLRGLPLRPPSAVLDYKGRVVLPADDAHLAAVVALDEGTADLQQCADSVMRLHAEWLWSTGHRTQSYRAASGAPMPFAKWIAGERPAVDGQSLVWKGGAHPVDRDDHGAFRKYLDAVFMFANTGALARDGAKVALADARPGDFFVIAGSPGHAVLILDMASNQGGERRLLLGQGYMPAQSFHVLRSGGDAVWFPVAATSTGVQTPFWPAPFPWSSLRRLD